VDVGIGEQQHRRAGEFRALLHGIGFAEPSGGQVGIVEDAQSGVLLRQALRDLARRVGGVVVDEDDLEIDAGLDQQRAQGGFQRLRLVAGGDDDGELRLG
jgi:hypothetical protein